MDYNEGKKILSSLMRVMRQMRDNGRCIQLCLMTILCVIIPQIFFLSISHPTPFAIPEKFIYDLTWTGIKAGTASLELRNEEDKVRIISTAQSAPWVSVFYTVNDRVESTLLKKSPETFFQPSQYRIKIREGRHRRDKEIIFDVQNTDRKSVV